MSNIKKNIDFYEQLAKTTLQLVWCEDFFALEYSDRPDLIDRDKCLGIEVTHPACQEEMLLDSFYRNELEGKLLSDIDRVKLEKFRKFGRDIMCDEKTGRVCACRAENSEFDINIIFEAINNKVRKLNQGLYQYDDNLYLYLELAYFSLESSNVEVAKQILQYAIQKKSECKKFFKQIFVDCIGMIYRIDLSQETIEKQDIDMEKVLQELMN